ncbi:unnamed protein product [Ectocarpus sp. 12 AP-2014]
MNPVATTTFSCRSCRLVFHGGCVGYNPRTRQCPPPDWVCPHCSNGERGPITSSTHPSARLDGGRKLGLVRTSQLVVSPTAAATQRDDVMPTSNPACLPLKATMADSRPKDALVAPSSSVAPNAAAATPTNEISRILPGTLASPSTSKEVAAAVTAMAAAKAAPAAAAGAAPTATPAAAAAPSAAVAAAAKEAAIDLERVEHVHHRTDGRPPPSGHHYDLHHCKLTDSTPTTREGAATIEEGGRRPAVPGADATEALLPQLPRAVRAQQPTQASANAARLAAWFSSPVSGQASAPGLAVSSSTVPALDTAATRDNPRPRLGFVRAAPMANVVQRSTKSIRLSGSKEAVAQKLGNQQWCPICLDDDRAPVSTQNHPGSKKCLDCGLRAHARCTAGRETGADGRWPCDEGQRRRDGVFPGNNPVWLRLQAAKLDGGFVLPPSRATEITAAVTTSSFSRAAADAMLPPVSQASPKPAERPHSRGLPDNSSAEAKSAPLPPAGADAAGSQDLGQILFRRLGLTNYCGDSRGTTGSRTSGVKREG